MATVKDPVCGMKVDTDKASGSSEYRGETYYFCCPECKQKFDESPQRYAAQQHASQ